MQSEEEFRQAIENSPTAWVKDSSGNSTNVTGKEMRESGLYKTVPAAGSAPVYQTETGWSMNPYDAKTSITLNKDTGDIVIKAPKIILDDPSFNDVFNTETLKQFSSAYKRNPDFKIPDPFNVEDEEKDITIPEIVEKYNEQMKDFVKALKEENQFRNQIATGQSGYSNRNDVANRLTRDDFIIMSNNATGEGANDKSLISIPKSMYADVNFLDSFDPVAGTVEKGEFRDKVFSINKKGDEYVKSIYSRIEDYFENDNFEDTEEYARMTALNDFILNNDPDADFFNTARLVFTGGLTGAGLNARETLLGLANLVSNISLPFGGVTGMAISAPLKSEISNATAEGLEATKKEYEETEKLLGQLSTAGKTAMGVGKVAEELIEAIIPSSVAGKAAKTATKASLAAREAATVAREAEALTVGADAMIAASSTAEAAKIGKAAVDISRKAKFLSEGADLVAQTITEAVISDPVVFSKILQGQETDGIEPATDQDAYGYLLETAAWNVGGWGAFTVAAKGVKNFGKTKVGRYTNAVAQKYLNKVPVTTGRVGEKMLKMRYGDDWLDGSKSARKIEARKANYNLRNAQEVVAKQKIGLPFSKDAGKNVREQEQNIVKLMNLHNATDALQRGASAYARVKLDPNIHPKLSGYEEKLRALGAKITKAERKAGLSSRRRSFRKDDKYVDRVFSKYSANYISSKTELDTLENIKRIRKGGLTDAQKKGEEILNQKLAEAKTKLPKETQDMLDEYLSWERKFYGELNDLLMTEGTLNSRQIEELRAEGLWGKNGELYRPSYRVDPDKEVKIIRNDDRIVRDNDTATEQYVWGSDKDFMDPEIARYMYLMDAGARYNSKRYIEAVNAIPSSKAHVVHDADEVARAQRMKDIKKPLNKRIKDVTRGVFKTGAVATGESAERSLRLYKMRANWVKQQGKTQKAKLSLGRADTNKIKTTVTDRRSAINAMNQSQIDNIFSEAGIEFNISRINNNAEFEAFYNSLDKNTQKLLQKKMGNAAGILYPEDTVSKLDRAVDRLRQRMPSTEKTTATKKRTKKEWKENPSYDPDYMDGREMDFIEGRITEEDFLEEQKERMWESLKNSNQGTDTFYHRDERGQIDRRDTVSYNGTLYRNLYEEYGGKPTKAEFNEAFEDIIKNRENSKYYQGFREFDSSGNFDLGYNAGNEDILTIFEILDLAEENSRLTKTIIENEPLIKNAPYITTENYNKLAKLDSNFIPSLKKSYIQNNVELRDSNAVKEIAEKGYRDKLVAEREGIYKENLRELNKLTDEGLTIGDADAILKEFDDGIDEYITEVYADKKLNQTLDDIIEQSGTVDKEAAKEYIVLEEIIRDDTQELSDLRQASKDVFKGDAWGEKVSDDFERMFMDKIYDRRNIARQKLADEESTIVDRKSWMEEIRKADKEITGKLSEPGYISIPNSKGEMEVWEVDPIAADLYKYSVRQSDMNAIAKFFNETSKIFRLGTTGLNLMSYVNQSFRDFGNLWLTSGSYHMIGLSRADVIDLFGPEIANWYLREEPEIYSQLLKQAERQGKDINRMVVERELALGRETSTQATETALLKTVGDAQTLTRISKGEERRISNSIDRIVDFAGRPNEARERYFRNIVYADSLNQALKRGYTLKDARIQAEFMMNNATTNFSRKLVHLQALQRTVPYLGAAINGTKSFFRILSVDPVGVMSRFVGGFVIPVMAFTGAALADPTTRNKYEQLNEYEKDNNIIFPINGSLMKIPIPQEIGSLVKPWQHLVEKMHDSNRHDFWELMLNDALGISPLDITGFYDLDQDNLENPTVWDRLDNGVKQLLVGQMSPPPVKTAYMLATGKDPYTGKFIDTSYKYYDEESGEVLTMDSTKSAFAQAMADVFGGPASVISAAVTALVGRTGSDVLDTLTTTSQYVGSGGKEGGNWGEILGKFGESAVKPISVADYDRTKAAWNREISALYREKESIQNDPKYKEIEDALNQETDTEKIKKLKAQRQDMLEPWYEKTRVAINKLQDNLGGTIDKYRMASLVSLLNMHESSGGIGITGRAANDELYYEGRDEATRALIDMGATEVGDRSILGYMKKVKHNDGSESVEVRFNKPLEILAMQNAWYDHVDVSVAYIQELLENGPIDYTQKKKAIKNQIDAIYAKGKLTKNDYDAINAIKINWNAEVMQAIEPYIERMTPESAINNDEVIQYLKKIIYVPDDIKIDRRGYHVTNKSLAGGNANEAYIKKFLQSAYGVNDTGYESGVNYSGRQTLGEK